MDDPQYDLYFQVLQTLENLQIAYVIIGAFAGVSYGVTRITYDIDIVVDLKSNQIETLTEAFPPPRYYADAHQIRESIRFGMLFNIIDTSVASKVDLIPLTMEPGYGFALANRRRRRVPFFHDSSTEAWFAKPEDVIIGKLMAWHEGKSFKHETDIRDILISVYLGDDPDISENFDFNYINEWTTAVGGEIEQFWVYLQHLSKLHLE